MQEGGKKGKKEGGSERSISVWDASLFIAYLYVTILVKGFFSCAVFPNSGKKDSSLS